MTSLFDVKAASIRLLVFSAALLGSNTENQRMLSFCWTGRKCECAALVLVIGSVEITSASTNVRLDNWSVHRANYQQTLIRVGITYYSAKVWSQLEMTQMSSSSNCWEGCRIQTAGCVLSLHPPRQPWLKISQKQSNWENVTTMRAWWDPVDSLVGT